MEKRHYRKWSGKENFVSFEITAGETDVWVSVPKDKFYQELKEELTELVLHLRKEVEFCIESLPEFSGLRPIDAPSLFPEIGRKMAVSSKKFGVGPMAGVAGAVSFFMGRFLKEKGIREFFIENGGDVYAVSRTPFTVGIFCGKPEIDGKLALNLKEGEWGICSSSSYIGHSVSFGRASIATVLCDDPVDADCCATLFANSSNVDEVKEKYELFKDHIKGVFCLIEGKVFIAGQITLSKVSPTGLYNRPLHTR